MKYTINLYVNGELYSQHELDYMPQQGQYIRFADDDPKRDNIEYKIQKIVSILDTNAINVYVSKS